MPVQLSPISHAAIAVKAPRQYFLFEAVTLHYLFINFYPDTWPVAGFDYSKILLHGKSY